ncbi:MAG: acyl-CoA thioesterase, partial [Alistipes sp.]|nr:acyl-CoA thioesterase [Alistipes sp.]
MSVTLRTDIQMRVSDIDMFHHVNNVSQQMYFDLGKRDLYAQVLEIDVLAGALRIVAAATSNSFIRQVRMGDDLFVTTTVERIGNKSITLFQQLIAREADGSEVVKSESRSVMVAFDFCLVSTSPRPRDRPRS